MTFDRILHNKMAPMERAVLLIPCICIENPIQISAEKILGISKLIDIPCLAWVLAICNDKYSLFTDIEKNTDSIFRDLERTANRYNHLIYKHTEENYSNNSEKAFPWYPSDLDNRSYKLHPVIVCDLIKSRPEFNHLLVTTGLPIEHKESHRFSQKISEAKYKEDAINNAVVEIILPKLLPISDQELSNKQINKLCWQIFIELGQTLNNNGCKVADNLPKSNKKHGLIKGEDEYGELIDLTYEALSKRVKNTLLNAYQYKHGM